MDREKKEKIALFRFGVIAPLTALRNIAKGERERHIREITQKQWDIPFSGRSFICRATVQDWLKRYQASSGRLESLWPKARQDHGRARSMDTETQAALILLKKEFPRAPIGSLLKIARERKLLPPDFHASPQSIYRLFEHHNLNKHEGPKENFQKFEAELPNDLWQADCLHGPLVLEGGKKRKTFLFALIDDHSRIISHAEFYRRENLENFSDCLQKALQKRGLPRKLYLDNGPSFRSHQLGYACASLGIALIHATCYRPEGKGKIERWFKTLRAQYLFTLPDDLSLELLNAKLWHYIDQDYHLAGHSSTGEKPIERFTKNLHLIRPAPADLHDAFRKKVHRKVTKDRTVSLSPYLFEAPLGLSGKTVTLLFHEKDPLRVEVFYQDLSQGFLVPLNPHVNYRRRSFEPKDKPHNQNPDTPPESGRLFS